MNPVPRWAVYATWALSLVGLGISTYLTIAHFGGSHLLVCSDTGVINCSLVTTSPQSVFWGVPVAILGLGQYVAMSIINSPWAWRAPWRWLAYGRLLLATVGMGFVLWLFYAEMVIIGHICLWCSGVHVVTLLLLLILTRATPAQLGGLRPTAARSVAPLR